MTATLHTLPRGERNPALVLAKRLAILAKPDVQAQVAALDALLREYRGQSSVNHKDGRR